MTNDGNGPDRFDFRLALVTDAFGVDVIWDTRFHEKRRRNSPDTYQKFDVTMNVPNRASRRIHRGFASLLEEVYPDASGRETRIRDTIVLATVDEFHDMQIPMDPTVDNAVKTSALKDCSPTFNVTNNGTLRCANAEQPLRSSRWRHLGLEHATWHADPDRMGRVVVHHAPSQR